MVSPGQFFVSSTNAICIAKKQDSFTDVNQVYDWIAGFLGNTWKDPVCGDGVCEAPFEFAYYGSFFSPTPFAYARETYSRA